MNIVKKNIVWGCLIMLILTISRSLPAEDTAAPEAKLVEVQRIWDHAPCNEFTYLVRRYESDINWREWLEKGSNQGLDREFRGYLTLAHRLMGMPFPKDVPRIHFVNVHVARISHAGNNRANYLSGCESPSEKACERIEAVASRMLNMLHDRLKNPAWVWQNLCYKEGIRNIPIRIFYLFKFFVKRTHFKKTFNINNLLSKSKKAIFLLKKPNLP